MKYLNKSIYAFALVGMAGLWSCSQEDVLQGGDVTASGHPVPVTLTVNRGDAQTRTRTVLSENPDGTLNDIWSDGDKLAVYSADGKIYHGDLTIVEGGSSEGVFSGTLDNVTDGTADYYLWYVNRDNDKIESAKDNSNVYIYNIDYYNQNFENIAELSKMDVLNQKITLAVKGEVASVVQNYTMESKLAMVHFSLAGDLSNASGTLQVYDDNRTTMCPITSGYFRVTSLNGKEPRPGNHDDSYKNLAVKVENGEAYLALQPCTTQLRFEFEKDGKIYNYAFENTTELKAGYYYSTELTLESEEEVVDHSKNPLLKWAETNLVYNKSTKSSSAADNSYTRSSLYQWGRNKGWSDYIDAQGPNYSSGTNTYALCTTNGYSQFGASDFTGNNTHTINWYNGASTDKLYVDYFLMNGSLCNTSYPEDYWPLAARQNDDWNKRAEACGYNELTSDDWTVPSKADYEAILPSNLSSLSTNDLKDGYIETKNIDENTDCIFRWRLVSRTENTTVALHIQTLVIPKGKTYSSTEWVSDKNVQELYFGASGMINAYMETLYVHKRNGAYQSSNVRYRSGWTFIGEQTIANPAPDGYFEADVSTVGGVHIYFHDIWDGWALQGNYWTSDGYAMKFCWDPYDQLGEGSYLKLEKEDKSRAFAVRCVKVKK